MVGQNTVVLGAVAGATAAVAAYRIYTQKQCEKVLMNGLMVWLRLSGKLVTQSFPGEEHRRSKRRPNPSGEAAQASGFYPHYIAQCNPKQIR
jgi:hypothetical protein